MTEVKPAVPAPTAPAEIALPRELDPTFVGPVPAATPEQVLAAVEKASPGALADALPMISQVPSLAGPLAVALSGLRPIEHDEFAARAAVSSAGSTSAPSTPGRPGPSTPLAPGGGGPIAGVDSGAPNGGGAGSSGSAGHGGMPLAVLLDPDSAPSVFALSLLTAPERRITWWYPEVVVGPG